MSCFKMSKFKSLLKQKLFVEMLKRELHWNWHDKGGKAIQAVEFAMYGDRTGACGAFKIGLCDAKKSKIVVEETCMGNSLVLSMSMIQPFNKPSTVVVVLQRSWLFRRCVLNWYSNIRRTCIYILLGLEYQFGFYDLI